MRGRNTKKGGYFGESSGSLITFPPDRLPFFWVMGLAIPYPINLKRKKECICMVLCS